MADSSEGAPLQKKLSAKIIMGDTAINARLIPQGQDGLDLFRVVGIATDTKSGESNYGAWTALLGDFQATNLLTGEVFRAAKIHLPNIVQEMVEAKMAGQGQDGRGVSFAFDIGIKLDKDPRNGRGYIYTARPLIKPQEDDPMEKLAASLPPPKVKALKHESKASK